MNIKDPAIWRELLSTLSHEKLAEVLLFKNDKGVTGFQFAAAFIRDPTIWKRFSPAAIHIVKHIHISNFWSKEVQKEINAWKFYISNPKNSIAGPNAEAYLQFLENAIPNNPSLIAYHDQWLSQLDKSLSCAVSEDKNERLRHLYIRVALARYTATLATNSKEENKLINPEKLSGAEQEILINHIRSTKKIDRFSANESFQMANLLAKNSAD